MATGRIGILYVVSAPSGAGKTTVITSVLESEPLHYSISCTTREPRAGEVDGRHYHFLSPDDFLRKVHAGEFLEHAEVHGHHYGTLRAMVTDRLARGQDVLVDVDTRGAAMIRTSVDPMIRESLADIFILPRSREELEIRLRSRGTESEDAIRVRLENATIEMGCARDYKYTIISGSREDDLAAFLAIVQAERLLTRRQTTEPNPFKP